MELVILILTEMQQEYYTELHNLINNKDILLQFVN